ncbi:hypothetical protein C0581_02730 [Candidatus Parcubacteria bacterium]|nr:MAG: hypothetical protein C0581_02730 [Candidatus Parcubacteria bacterium]
MHDPAVKHTLSIFERIYDNLPPLVPEEVSGDMGRHLTSVQNNYDISLTDLENTMIGLGKHLWPYMQAFEEMYHVYEEKLAEKLLAQKASHGVRKKYDMFKDMGGSFRELYHGSVNDMFDYDERQELSGLLVDLKADIRKHAMHASISHDRDMYDKKVEKYGEIIKEINDVIEGLHTFANEEEHEDFADDVRDRARAIEHSLTFLGPKMSIEEIRGSQEYYRGKKIERKMRR